MSDKDNDNDRVFKHLLFYQKEIVYGLGNLCLRVGNDSDSRQLVELAQVTTRAITAINELRKIDQKSRAGRLCSHGVGRVTDPREIPRAPVSQALVKKIPFKPVPGLEHYPIFLDWKPPNGNPTIFESPRRAPSPPVPRRAPSLPVPRRAPSPPVSLPDTVDDEPDPSDDLDQIIRAPSGILMHPYPAGYYPSEAYRPLPIYHPEEPSLPLAATPTSMRSKASSLASESSASGFEARVHMLWERCFKAGDDDDDDDHRWGCVWYGGRDEGESADKAGGDTVDAAKDDVDASSVTGPGDEIDASLGQMF